MRLHELSLLLVGLYVTAAYVAGKTDVLVNMYDAAKHSLGL